MVDDMDRRKFFIRTVGGGVVLLSSGGASCPSAEEWFQIAAGLVPIVLQTVGEFQTINGGLSPALETAITTFSTDATAILNDVATDIGVVKNNTSIIPKISSLLSQLQLQATQLLPQFIGNVGPLKWINAILADATDLVSLVPIITQATGGTATAAARITIVKPTVALPTAKTYKQVFQLRLVNAKAA